MLFFQTLRVNHEISDHQDFQLHSLRYCTFCLTAVGITRYSKAVEKSVCQAKSSTLSKQTRAPFVRGTTFSFWSFLGLFLVSNLVICRSLRCRHLLPALTHMVARSRSLHNRFSQVVGMEALMIHHSVYLLAAAEKDRGSTWILIKFAWPWSLDFHPASFREKLRAPLDPNGKPPCHLWMNLKHTFWTYGNLSDSTLRLTQRQTQ